MSAYIFTVETDKEILLIATGVQEIVSNRLGYVLALYNPFFSGIHALYFGKPKKQYTANGNKTDQCNNAYDTNLKADFNIV